MEVHEKRAEPWRVTLVDTGEATMTGGRLNRVAEYIKDEDEFLFTYGDGVSDIDITETIAFHRQHGKLATLTATYPPGRFGALKIKDRQVMSFQEKPKGDGGMINGGFFVLSPKVLDYIEADSTVWEQYPLNQLSADGELMSFEHKGFGNPWIPCVTSTNLKSFGPITKPHGRNGNGYWLLEGEKSTNYRAYWL